MKKFILAMTVLISTSVMWAKQYVYLSTNYFRLTANGKLRDAKAKCEELIVAGYRIVCVNTDEDSFLIVYENDE